MKKIIIINEMKWFRFLLIACIAAVSCTNEVAYVAPVFVNKQPKEIRVLNDEYIFRHGNNPMLSDSLLIVSTFNDENHIAVFDRYKGTLLKEFGRKGQGPSELLIPTRFSIDKSNRFLYVSDIGKRTLLRYELSKVLEKGIPEYETIKISKDFAKSSMVSFLKDSLFYAPASKEGRLLVGIPSEVQCIMTSETPDINKFPTQEDWYYYMNAQSVKAVRPDGRYLATGSALGGILEIFDLNSMERVALRHFYEPIFKQNGHVFYPVPETIGGFAYLAATDKYLYATLHGKANPTSMPTFICRFDWQGNPIDRYDCGKYPIYSFTVTEDDRTIYAVAAGEDGEHILIDIEL